MHGLVVEQRGLAAYQPRAAVSGMESARRPIKNDCHSDAVSAPAALAFGCQSPAFSSQLTCQSRATGIGAMATVDARNGSGRPSFMTGFLRG
jgi:hypothetical protein